LTFGCYLCDKGRSLFDFLLIGRIIFNATTELFRVIAPKVAGRPGGYTRILKTGFRQSDGADMCFIELVDFNDLYSQNKGAVKAAEKPKTRRSTKKKAAPAAEAPAAEAPAAEAPATEAADE